MFGVGVEERTGRYLFSVKGESVAKAIKKSGGGDDEKKDQVGVYLDTITAMILIDTPERVWIFWLSPDSEGKVKGHSVSTHKTEEERNVDILENFRKDLSSAQFSTKKLFSTNSLNEAKDVLIKNLNVEPKAADNIVLYLIKNQ